MSAKAIQNADRAACRVSPVSSAQVVRARVDVDAVGLMTGEIRGDAQPLEVGRLERGSPVARRELRVLRLPVPRPGDLRARSLVVPPCADRVECTR